MTHSIGTLWVALDGSTYRLRAHYSDGTPIYTVQEPNGHERSAHALPEGARFVWRPPGPNDIHLDRLDRAERERLADESYG